MWQIVTQMWYTEVTLGYLSTEPLPLPAGNQCAVDIIGHAGSTMLRLMTTTANCAHFLFVVHQTSESLPLCGSGWEMWGEVSDLGRTNCGLRSTSHLSASRANPPAWDGAPWQLLHHITLHPHHMHTHPLKPNASHQYYLWPVLHLSRTHSVVSDLH